MENTELAAELAN